MAFRSVFIESNESAVSLALAVNKRKSSRQPRIQTIVCRSLRTFWKREFTDRRSPDRVLLTDITYGAPRLGISRGACPWNARNQLPCFSLWKSMSPSGGDLLLTGRVSVRKLVWLQGTLILVDSRDLVRPVCQNRTLWAGVSTCMLNFENMKP
jgi:hypothetical protein